LGGGHCLFSSYKPQIFINNPIYLPSCLADRRGGPSSSPPFKSATVS